MEIIVGRNAGFCFGVKRAFEGALNEVNKKDKKVYCLGELVHNKEVIDSIEKAGITIISNVEQVKDKNVKLIIRAHGVDKKIYDIAKLRKIDVINLTCPLVSKIHSIVEEYKNKGYYIFLIGNKNHPEILGTKTYCGENYFIIENIDEVENSIDKFLKTKLKNLLVIVQTTFSKNKFESIAQKIKLELDSEVNIVIKNTICNATRKRQNETKDISKNVELMIIVGGKNSSNTQKLYEISKEQTKTLLIETINDLDLEKLKKYKKIGIMAGTSTPQESIDILVDKLKSLN